MVPLHAYEIGIGIWVLQVFEAPLLRQNVRHPLTWFSLLRITGDVLIFSGVPDFPYLLALPIISRDWYLIQNIRYWLLKYWR